MTSREIDAVISKHRSLAQELLISMGSTVDIAVALEKLKESEKVQKLEDAMKSYVDMEAMISNHISALEDLKAVVINRRTEDLASLFSSTVKELENSTDKMAFKKHGKFREFRQKVWHVHHQSEALPEELNEEIVMMSQEENLTCPITRLELVEPMKNSMCGHRYSKDAIYNYLGKKRRDAVDCPVAGCNAKIQMSTLTLDVELDRKLKKKGKRKAPEKETDEGYTRV